MNYTHFTTQLYYPLAISRRLYCVLLIILFSDGMYQNTKISELQLIEDRVPRSVSLFHPSMDLPQYMVIHKRCIFIPSFIRLSCLNQIHINKNLYFEFFILMIPQQFL